jgi:signal transduction histidine kinase
MGVPTNGKRDMADTSNGRELAPLPPSGADACLAGGGRMGELMRAKDWSTTPVGPVSGWPQSLRTAVGIALDSGYAMLIAWGPDYVQFYNDAFRPILGASKHPAALGQSTRECFAEIWEIIGPLFEGVMERGETTTRHNEPFLLDRSGYAEETYFTFSYSAIRHEGGGVGGVLVTCMETTERVLGERRLLTLRELAARAAEAQTVESTCGAVAETLATNDADIPFALLYLAEEGGDQIRLACRAGFADDAGPARRELDDPHGGVWPVAAVVGSGRAEVVEVEPSRFGALPGGPSPDPPSRAIVLPILHHGQERAAGALVVGLGPQRALDDAYREFLELVAAQVSTALANARAYDEERRRAAALAEIDRAKTRFFSNVSHEFRTPLTLMLGPAEDALADTGEPLGDRQRHRVEVMHRSGLRLLKLVNALLDFSRIETGRIEAVYEPTDLTAYTAELASMFRSAVEGAGVGYVVDCEPLGEEIFVDRDMWEKIVFNLLSNALKFTFEGTIEVRLRDAGAGAELTVRDTGVGIPEAELPRVFERFHRVQGVHGRTHEGTGIGLALVEALVNLHGGSVRVESAVGRGTTFTVSLPFGRAHLRPERVHDALMPAPTRIGASAFVEEALMWLPDDARPRARASGTRADDALAASAVAAADRPRVLVVDDNADMREYLRSLLEGAYTVETAADGEDALRAARARRPDLVLSDVMMPKLDGFELLRAFRGDARLRTVPFALLSARAGEEARLEGLDAGADDYLVKPFGARELLARVRVHVEMARIREEAARRERQLREEADAANRAKDEFLATVSHELRTPLNAMLGWTTMLRSGRLGEEETRRALDTIDRNARSQAQLIEDLLDVSRIISGKVRLDVRHLKLAAVVEEAIEVVRPAAEAKQIHLVTTLDPSAGPVAGDAERIKQVVWNLLSNAVKFTPKEGRVQVELKRVNSHVELVVADTGIGIAPGFLPYVFERFRQAESSDVQRQKGLGLGLAIVKHLVELHGGDISVESAGEGRGATFTLCLPIAAVTERSASGDHFHPLLGEAIPLGPDDLPDLGGRRILVVDDEADAREMLEMVLRGCYAEVRTAASADEAMEAIVAWRPDLMVSDIGMPGEDGYSLIARVRALDAEEGGRTLAVALTAFARLEDRMRVLGAGFEMHVAKPVEPAELVMVIASLVGRRRPVRESRESPGSDSRGLA